MRLHRFFVSKKIERETLFIEDEALVHQWRNVFRLGVGDRVILFDGSGDEFILEIKKITKDKAELNILEKRKGIISEKEISLFVGIPKKDKFEWIVEKATELGVSHITPMITERSEKKDINNVRINKIIIEASEQSGRATLPILHEVDTLEKALSGIKIPLIVCDGSGEKSTEKIFSKDNKLSIFIGPEGGFTEKELLIFKNNNAKIISLGDQTLRTETAAVSALSLALLK